MNEQPIRPLLDIPAGVTRRKTLLMLSSTAVLVACGGDDKSPSSGPTPTPTSSPTPTSGPAWYGYGRNAQHTGQSAIASQNLNRVAWSTPVDTLPQYTPSGALLTHYGSPVISQFNTVVLPVKTTANGSSLETGGHFRIEGRNGANGLLIWTRNSDYMSPPHNWFPPYNLQLTQDGKLYAPGAGGKLLVRPNPDQASATFAEVVFYGSTVYASNPTAFRDTVFINTPLTADDAGNIFFGFMVTGTNPAGLVSGIARVGADGSGSWIGAAAAAADNTIAKPAMNCAPALSNDGSTLYIAVNRPRVSGVTQTGMLLALDSTTLAVKARRDLIDPNTGSGARVSDDGSGAPVIAPDGKVFYGVLETTFPAHNARGWMLQFDADLNPAGVPGSFGWDVSPSIVPASIVPSYTGTSAYLIATKYNNYNGVGTGDGLNRLAVLDPNNSQPDPVIPSVNVMREVFTILGPTLDGGSATARREWCINTFAVDVERKSILANNEDGMMYRWDLTTNTLSQGIRLTTGIGQAYTPTLVGADGGVYAINNATLYAIRAT